MRPQLQRLREHLEPFGVAPAEALALLILLAAAATLTGLVWWTSQPAASGAAPAPGGSLTEPAPSPSTSAGPADAIPATDGMVVVHVAGEVRQPGVVTLPTGARVEEAIQAAGGPTAVAVLDALNLARALSDGEQVRVPGPGEEGSPPPAAGDPSAADASAAGPPAPLDLNTATAEQLQDLPGIGPVTAERIITHRTAIGGFAAVTQLLEVPGIGPARFAELEARVRV